MVKTENWAKPVLKNDEFVGFIGLIWYLDILGISHKYDKIGPRATSLTSRSNFNK